MKTAAIIGGGVIGGGWAARFALMGWNVQLFDPSPGAGKVLEAMLWEARRALPGLHRTVLPPEGSVRVMATLEEAVAGAEWIQESVPEQKPLKQTVLRAIEACCTQEAIIGSSTSGLTPSALQEGLARPDRVIVAHPFNPVYLLPLVELSSSAANPEPLLARATAILSSIGMHPLRLGAEIEAHIADRLLEAVWREALWLVRDEVATTGQVDDAIRFGFGLRWAQMGLFETYRIAGGPEGMAHFIEQFGPALAWPWSRLTDVPELDAALIERISAQSDAQADGRSVEALARQRDASLVAILRALKAQDHAAGALLNAHDRMCGPPCRYFAEAEDGEGPIEAPLLTLAHAVPLDWTDYNGHMNEARYLQAFGDATDRVMEIIGCDAAYIAGGESFFTAETHIRHVDEVLAGTVIRVETQIIRAEGRKLHLFHRMLAGERLLATGEHFLLHVNLETRRPSDPAPLLAGRMARLTEAHAVLGGPEGAGRRVGQKPGAVR